MQRGGRGRHRQVSRICHRVGPPQITGLGGFRRRTEYRDASACCWTCLRPRRRLPPRWERRVFRSPSWRGVAGDPGCSARAGWAAHLPRYAAKPASSGTIFGHTGSPTKNRDHRAAPAGWRPTRRTRPGNCGLTEGASKARPPRRTWAVEPDPALLAVSRAAYDAGTNVSHPEFMGCTTWRPTRWRGVAGNCCGSRCARSPTSAGRTCQGYSGLGWQPGLTALTPAPGAKTCELISLCPNAAAAGLAQETPSPTCFALERCCASTQTALVIQTHRATADRDSRRLFAASPRRRRAGWVVGVFHRAR